MSCLAFVAIEQSEEHQTTQRNSQKELALSLGAEPWNQAFGSQMQMVLKGASAQYELVGKQGMKQVGWN